MHDLKNVGITFTGVTEEEQELDLLRLAKDYPNIEYGVLYSEKEQGKGRYADLNFIAPFGRFCKSHGINSSLHICGKRSLVRLITSPHHFANFLRAGYKRLQINFNATEQDHAKLLASIRTLLSSFPNHQIITQHNDNNQTIWYKLFDYPNYQILWDSSCGTGKAAGEAKVLPDMQGRQGYAGGINSKNVSGLVSHLRTLVPKDYFWIDMESSLRTNDDMFDIHEARRVCENVHRTLNLGTEVNDTILS